MMVQEEFKSKSLSRILSEEGEKVFVNFIFQALNVANDNLISLKDLPFVLDPTVFRKENVGYDPQLLILLTKYCEDNPDLNITYEQLGLLVTELSSSMSMGLISSSMPESNGFSALNRTDSHGFDRSKRKSFLAHRKRTNPLPSNPTDFTPYPDFNLGEISFSSRNSIMESPTFSPQEVETPFFQTSRLSKTNSQSFENNFSKRMSLGFVPCMEDVTTSASDNTVRRVASELGRKLVTEKEIYSNIIQDTKKQILQLESNNAQLKDKVNELSKTVCQLRETKKNQDGVFSTIEEDNVALHEREEQLLKETRELKRKITEKNLDEKKLKKDLENTQSRATEAEAQIKKHFEAQRRLKQEKTKLLQAASKIKKESDRALLESQLREQALLEKINSIKDQSMTSIDFKTPDSHSQDYMDIGSPPSDSNSLKNFMRSPIRNSNNSLRKKAGIASALPKYNKKLKATLDKVWALLEETRDSFEGPQNEKVQEAWGKITSYKEQVQTILSQDLSGSPSNSKLSLDGSGIQEDYHVSSARRGFLKRGIVRRGSYSLGSPKRLSLLIPHSKLNSQSLSPASNTEQEIESSTSSVASSPQVLTELEPILHSDSLSSNRCTSCEERNNGSELKTESSSENHHQKIPETPLLGTEKGIFLPGAKSSSAYAEAAQFKPNELNSNQLYSPRIGILKTTEGGSMRPVEKNSLDLNLSRTNSLKNYSSGSSVEVESFRLFKSYHTKARSPLTQRRRSISDDFLKDRSLSTIFSLKLDEENGAPTSTGTGIKHGLAFSASDELPTGSYTNETLTSPLYCKPNSVQCHNCGHRILLSNENMIKVPLVDLSSPLHMSKKSALTPGIFTEPEIIPEFINPASSLKTTSYLTRYIPHSHAWPSSAGIMRTFARKRSEPEAHSESFTPDFFYVQHS